MVKNYDRFNKTNIKVYTGHKIIWQRYVRSMVSHTTSWAKEYGKEVAITVAHNYFNNIQSKTYRIRAYKRFGKWLRETES